MATPGDPRSLARRIADDLREQIRTGRITGKLPSARELSEQYGCALVTAQQAVNRLRAEGLVTTRQGAGAFVRRRRVVRRDLIKGLRMEYQRSINDDDGNGTGLFEAATGIDTEVEIRYTRQAAGQRIAHLLRIDPDDQVLMREYRYAVDGERYQIARSYLLGTLVSGTELESEECERPGRGTIAQLKGVGVLVTNASINIEARMPSPEEAADWIPAGTPVFEVTRVLTTSTGQPVETAISLVRADLTAYTLDVDLTETR